MNPNVALNLPQATGKTFGPRTTIEPKVSRCKVRVVPHPASSDGLPPSPTLVTSSSTSKTMYCASKLELNTVTLLAIRQITMGITSRECISRPRKVYPLFKKPPRLVASVFSSCQVSQHDMISGVSTDCMDQCLINIPT